MDCKGFDEIVVDLLYEPASRGHEEAQRHAEGCSRCAGVLAALRRGRELADPPRLATPPGLEARVIESITREQQMRRSSGWVQISHAISLLGSYAMRPQAAMAALFMLMVGTSLLLLRARPAGPGAVHITENGVPAVDHQAEGAASARAAAAQRAVALPDVIPSRHEDERPAPVAARDAPRDKEPAADPAAIALAPSPAAPPQTTATATVTPGAAGPAAVAGATATAPPTAAAAATPPQDATYAAATDDFKARRYSEAVREFDIVANGGGGNAPQAALYAARATRYSAGCGAALSRFDQVASRYANSGVGAEASWEAAICYREVGQIDRARQLFSGMRRVAGYRDRAERELSLLDQRQGAEAPRGAAKAASSR
jgi:TolA-binding protein